MTISTGAIRIHGPHGVVERSAHPVGAPSGAARPRTVSDRVPITEIMSREVVCAFGDLAVEQLVEVMVGERLGCVPVVDHRRHPIGMVTKLDLVEQLAIVAPRIVRPVVADIMMPLAITLDAQATVAHAAALMAAEDTHHVMIVSGGHLIGVVSTMDITRWLAANDLQSEKS